MILEPQTRPTLSATAQRASAKGAAIYQKHGPHIGWSELQAILADRTVVSFPTDIEFCAEPLLAGECSHLAVKGVRPQDGYTIFVHPDFAERLSTVPYLVLFQLAFINFGVTTAIEDAECFGAHALGITQELYYRELCALAQDVAGDELC